MNARVLDILKNHESIQVEDLDILKSEIERYPYMQSLRAIYLLGIHRYCHEDFQKELTRTAAYTTDKKILYNLVNQEKIEKKAEQYIGVETAVELKQKEVEEEIDDAMERQEDLAVTVKDEEIIEHIGVETAVESEQKEIEEEIDDAVERQGDLAVTVKDEEIEEKESGINFYARKYIEEYKSKNADKKVIKQPIIQFTSPEYKTSIMDYYRKPFEKEDSKEEINTIEEKSVFIEKEKGEKHHDKKEGEWKPMKIDEVYFPNKEQATKAKTIEIESEEQKVKEEQEQKNTSNVTTFINTWQNWLKIDRTQQKELSEQEKKTAIIDKFIESNPKISPIKEEVTFEIKEKGDDISHLMTETLAQLYLEQKLYTKALDAYRILQEKHPDKKDYFAQRIEEIKESRNMK